ncbi:hypothetical protein FACS1894201_04930 [Bacteroidia bacterium]|nr:hypothetical protein FACS1894201_04930 [Bacteroidia bacterium]
MRRHTYIALIIATLLSLGAFSQGVYSSFLLPESARVAALGSHVTSIYDDDFSLALSNASMLRKEFSDNVLAHYANYFLSYSHLQVDYARYVENVGMFAASLALVNFGSIDEYDELGNYRGRSAGTYDVLMNIGWGRTLDSHFSLGANAKYMISGVDYDYVHSLAVDVSASYVHLGAGFSSTLMVKNIGGIIGKYPLSVSREIPFEVLLAVSQKLAHAPFRLCLVIPNLQKWNLLGEDANKITIDPITGNEIKPSKIANFGNNLLRHIVPGVELLLFKNFTFRMGYNFQRRQELVVASRGGATGLSWGIGLKIHHLHIDYSRSSYHLAGAPNYFTVSTNINDWQPK